MEVPEEEVIYVYRAKFTMRKGQVSSMEQFGNIEEYLDSLAEPKRGRDIKDNKTEESRFSMGIASEGHTSQ